MAASGAIHSRRGRVRVLGHRASVPKGRKGVEYMVRTAFPLDKLARDSRTNVVERLAIQPA